MNRCSILLLLATIACSGGDGPQGGPGGPGGEGGPRKEPVTVVEVQEVAPGEVAETLKASAVVESERAASLFPSASGVVLSIHADEGDHVTAGQLLAVLDNVSLDATAERAIAEVGRLEEQVREMEALASSGAVSSRELDDLRYQLQTARTSRREASRTFGQTRITAPFAGVVARRNVRLGELATGGTAAFEVVDLAQLRVVASLPERDLSRVAVGQPARLISAYDPDAVAIGRVSRISPVVDAGSGTFRATIEVAGDQRVLRPGQFVTVDLEVDRRRDVVVVPKRAVVYEDGNPVVYTKIVAPPPEEKAEEVASATDAGFLASLFGKKAEPPAEDAEAEEEAADAPKWVAERVPVKLGLVDEINAEILEGVEGGENVIVLGQSHLRDGARIRTPDEAPIDAAADKGDDGDRG